MVFPYFVSGSWTLVLVLVGGALMVLPYFVRL
jgi:hypothetical protein